MSIFHWLVIVILLLSLLMHGEQRKNIKFLFVAMLLLFIVCGLRDAVSVGTDSASSYYHGFLNVGPLPWEDIKDTFEEGKHNGWFYYLYKLVYEVFDGDYQWFVGIIAALDMIAVMFLINKYSPSPLQSVLFFLGLLYYPMMFGALKQCVAMAFIVFAFDAAMEKKPIRFLLLVLIGSQFHYPAIIFLPAYFLINIRTGRWYFFVLIGLFIVTYSFREQLLDWMVDVYDTEIIGYEGMRFLANKVIVMLVIIAAALIIRPPSPKDKEYSALLQMMGFAAVIQTFAEYNNTFERLADYYFIFAIIFIPMVFEHKKTEKQYLSEKMIVLVGKTGPYLFGAFAIWRFLDAVNAHIWGITPYQFYFQADKIDETLSILIHSNWV